MIVERRVNSGLSIQMGCNAIGQLGFLLLIADRSDLPPDTTNGAIEIAIEQKSISSPATLQRISPEFLGLSFDDREALSTVVYALGLTSDESFSITATCALWDGERRWRVGTKGLRKLAADLSESAAKQKSFYESLLQSGAIDPHG
jgi:hypothetical protein